MQHQCSALNRTLSPFLLRLGEYCRWEKRGQRQLQNAIFRAWHGHCSHSLGSCGSLHKTEPDTSQPRSGRGSWAPKPLMQYWILEKSQLSPSVCTRSVPTRLKWTVPNPGHTAGAGWKQRVITRSKGHECGRWSQPGVRGQITGTGEWKERAEKSTQNAREMCTTLSNNNLTRDKHFFKACSSETTGKEMERARCTWGTPSTRASNGQVGVTRGENSQMKWEESSSMF